MTQVPWPTGLMTALVTPLQGDRLDLPSLSKLIDRQIAAGVNGFVVTGGTGEYGALTFEERSLLFREVVSVVAGRVAVVAHTGCLSTNEAVRLGQVAQEAGVTGLLVASPFGEPINWRERYAFYREIAANAALPIMIYNTPPAGLLTFDQIKALGDLPGITAIKDSSGDQELMGDLLAWAQRSELAVYVGKDSFLYEAIVTGARGAVFGVANIIPELLVPLIDELRTRGSTAASLEAWRNLRPLLRFLERSENYVALCKVGCRMGGLDVGEVRAPYLMPSQAEIETLGTLLTEARSAAGIPHAI
jgi:4-hydroxy-tetrahydrodipicolinate synthase